MDNAIAAQRPGTFFHRASAEITKKAQQSGFESEFAANAVELARRRKVSEVELQVRWEFVHEIHRDFS
jgi:hypothetical protein